MTHDPNTTELAKNVTVQSYRQWVQSGETTQIADFVKQRVTERFLSPVRDSHAAHGFAMMAVACLMIESLESFRQGWTDTRYRSNEAFRLFFENNQPLDAFKPVADEFYLGVRCGILHQAETTGGWRIRRSGELIENRQINAAEFLSRLELCLDRYCDELKALPSNSPPWDKLRTKMDAICRNTE